MEYRPKLVMPVGMEQKPGQSFWEKIAAQLGYRASAQPSDSMPQVDPTKARDFIKGFQGN